MRVVVLGGGESGLGAAILAKKNGFDVFVSDYGNIEKQYKEELEKAEVDFEEGRHTFDKLKDADVVVKSPGIPDTAMIIDKLRHEGVEIISEVEWAYRFCSGFIIAITGTNGKTTTTGLCAHILKQAGLATVSVGNIGRSFSKAVADNIADYYVVEVSSFQLDNVVQFKPNIGAILNITPDHLDRYESFDDYAHTKLKLITQQGENDQFFYITERGIENYLEEKDSRVVPLNYHAEVSRMGLAAKCIQRTNNPHLRGPHNIDNMLVAVSIALSLGLDEEVVVAACNSFINEDHRMQWIGQLEGMDFINDSKATNVEACEKALQSFKNPIIWIVGGVDKGNDYDLLMPLVEEKVEVCIALGVDNEKLRSTFQDRVKTFISVDTMEAAVVNALKFGIDGATVLLSPACASFDLFENYKDRGNQFKRIVQEKNK